MSTLSAFLKKSAFPDLPKTLDLGSVKLVATLLNADKVHARLQFRLETLDGAEILYTAAEEIYIGGSLTLTHIDRLFNVGIS